jgi:hypothetical protein
MRDRLTYSNVVATLALFVALGGTGYAAATITSSDIKNRTIKGGDVKKNALGGTEINESKLRTVPNARRAQTAAGADISKNAETANQANSATNALNADVANVARDANTLAGQGAAAFESSSTVQFGKAPSNPAGASQEQVLLSWPAMGVELTSASGGGACGSDETRIGVRNTKPSGPTASIFRQGEVSEVASAPPGVTARTCTVVGSGQITDSTGRTLYFDCRDVDVELRCLGIRSEP